MLFGNGTNADVVDERNYETRRPWDMGVHLMRFLQENEKRYLMLIGRPGGIKKIKLNELRLRPCVDSNIIQHFFSCWTWPHLGLPSPRFNFKNKKVKNRFDTHAMPRSRNYSIWVCIIISSPVSISRVPVTCPIRSNPNEFEQKRLNVSYILNINKITDFSTKSLIIWFRKPLRV